MKSINYGAQEVADLLGVSQSKAYQVIRELNRELEEKGFFTIKGKVSRRYFERRFNCEEGEHDKAGI